jgi:hypothetical protein
VLAALEHDAAHISSTVDFETAQTLSLLATEGGASAHSRLWVGALCNGAQIFLLVPSKQNVGPV